MKNVAVTYQGNKRITTEEMMMNKKGEYLWSFSFSGGGFNDVWARTMVQAIAQAKKQFPETVKSAGINVNSFKRMSVNEWHEYNRMANMMTM